MSEVLAHDGTPVGSVVAADRFRDELLNLTENTLNSRYRARLVRQGDLWMEGVRLGIAMGKSKSEFADESEASPQPGEYYGGKWGLHVRAPDLWFDFLTRFDDRLTPLARIADVKRGITSGKDSFFFPKDASEEALKKHEDPTAFRQTYGAGREEVQSGEVKIVRSGEGYEEMRPMEARFLEPVVHGPMEIDGFQVSAEDCGYFMLQIPSDRKALSNLHALRYIERGEKQGVHQGETCRARITKDRAWFDLTEHKRAPALWVKERQYRHFAPANPENLTANCRLYEVYPPQELSDPDFWGGLLNSTLVFLSCFQYGRPVGNEGLWGTMVVDANMMLVPDPRKASAAKREAVAEAFRKMKDRPVLSFLSERRRARMNLTAKGREDELAKLSNETELTQTDRRKLDNAVFRMLGVESERERTRLIEELYDYLAEFFEWTRQKEEQANQNKKKAKKGKTATPQAIAREILAEVERDHGPLLRTYDDFMDTGKPYDTYEVPQTGTPTLEDGLFEQYAVRFVGVKSGHAPTVETRNESQRGLLLLLIEEGRKDYPQIPVDEVASENLLQRYSAFLESRDEALRNLIEARTADEELQDKVYDLLIRQVRSRAR
jgi:hypothetical protein